MKAAPVYLCFCWQMINDLKPELCVDQGPMPGNTPILYGCHFYSTQVCLDIKCLQTGGDFVFVGNCCSLVQHCFYRSDGQLYIGGIKSHKYNSNRCLVDPFSGLYPGLYDCKIAKQKDFHMLWDFTQVNISVFKYRLSET